MEQDNVATRLKVFMDSKELSNSQFADSCGIPRPTLSQLLSGRNKKISDVLIGQIHKAYPELSVLWLLFGEGEMLVSPVGVSSDDESVVEIDSPEGDFFMVEDRTGVFNAENGFTNASRADNSHDSQAGLQKYRKENGLNNGVNKIQHGLNQQIESTYKNAVLLEQIEKMRANPRKVTQITVYYDDSTFETFYPGPPSK